MLGFGKKELSVIIPVFNTKDYLRESLDSVLAATKNIDSEIILVDDGSTDGSLEIANQYVSENKKMRLILAENKGPGVARNLGTAEAKGKYLAFADSDDIVAEDIYERMLEVAKRDGCEMVVCDVIRKDGEKYIHSELHRKAYHNLRDRIVDINKDRSLTFDCTVWNRIIKASLYKDNKIEFPDALYCEDFPVVQKLYCLSKKTAFIHRWGYCWRVRKNSITRTYTHEHLVQEIKMLLYLKEIARECNPDPGYSRMIDYKILALEFVGCMNTLRSVPREEALENIELIANLIENNVDLDVAGELSLYNRQKIKLILDRDVEGLIQLLNYKKANYMNTPVSETGEGLQLVLPDDIFTVSSRSMKNEFNDTPYWLSIDSVESDEAKFVIHTHVYVRRVSMPDFSSQTIRAFLINDRTGRETELKTVPEKRESLTKARGEVLNYDDYRFYNYNYDGTGVSIEIDAGDIAAEKDFMGWNYVLLECENALGKKNLVLRFGTKKALDVINSTQMTCGGRTVSFSTDEIQVFWVRAE